MLDNILEFIYFHPEITVIGAITLIQISPIKLDPWGAIGKGIRKLFVGSIEGKLNSIAEKVGALEKSVEEDRAIQSRTHILRFADELYDGKHHSKEYFDEILDDIDRYEKYCNVHQDFKNNKTVMAEKLITSTYRTLIEEHKF